MGRKRRRGSRRVEEGSGGEQLQMRLKDIGDRDLTRVRRFPIRTT